MYDYKELIGKLRQSAYGRKHLCVSSGTTVTPKYVQFMFDAADAIEQLMEERDAAIFELMLDYNCDFCKWLDCGDCTDFEHEFCHGEHWEWHGIEGKKRMEEGFPNHRQSQSCPHEGELL